MNQGNKGLDSKKRDKIIRDLEVRTDLAHKETAFPKTKPTKKKKKVVEKCRKTQKNREIDTNQTHNNNVRMLANYQHKGIITNYLKLIHQ